MTQLLTPFLVLALAACASAPTSRQQAAPEAGGNGTICERDARTGTMLPTTRCTTRTEREAARRDVDAVSETVRDRRVTPASQPGS